MSDGGKGSTPRPIDVDKETYDKNWDRIFKKKENETQVIETEETNEN